jgi:hypothetical protein
VKEAAMFYVARYSFARPSGATQYAENELVANHGTAASVVPMKFNVARSAGRGRIHRVRLFTDNEAVTTATFNLHLFGRDPGVPGAGDNGAYSVTSNQYKIGAVACDLATGAEVTATDKLKGFVITGGLCFDVGVEGTALPADQKLLYGLLSTATAATYTPASGEVFEVTLEIEG